MTKVWELFKVINTEGKKPYKLQVFIKILLTKVQKELLKPMLKI